MKAASRLSKVGAAVALVLAIAAPQIAKADAVAQSVLDLSAFTFRAGNGAVGTSNVSANITVTALSQTSDTFASLAGVGIASGPSTSCVGNCGGYVAFTPFTSLVLSPTFVGSTSSTGGDGLGATAFARTDNTVMLKPSGDGTAQGNVNLNAEFNVAIAASGTKLEVRFDAVAFLRSYLTANGTATSAINWGISLTTNDGDLVFEWNPNGISGGISGGTEYLDPFSINVTRSTNSAANVVYSRDSTFVNGNKFEAETDGLAAGNYKLSIRHLGVADADLRVPEPGTISLISLALLGAGAALRRRRA